MKAPVGRRLRAGGVFFGIARVFLSFVLRPKIASLGAAMSSRQSVCRSMVATMLLTDASPSED